MTTIEDVVRQVETVLNETEYLPNQTELDVLRKVLKTISLHHNPVSGVHYRHPAPESQKQEVFCDSISDYMRLIEKHQQTLGVAIACRS